MADLSQQNLSNAEDQKPADLTQQTEQAKDYGKILKSNLLPGLKALSSMSQAAAAGLKTMASAGAQAAGALGGAAASSLQAASQLSEAQRAVDNVFGAQGGQAVSDWAQTAVSSYGLSETAARQYASSLGSMLKGMGAADDQLLTMSTSLAGLAGDFASFYNLDPADTFAQIQAAISGDPGALSQLGVDMSQASLEAFALSQGLSTAYGDMSQMEQATLRYNYLMSASAQAQGSFANSQDSLASQMNLARLQTDHQKRRGPAQRHHDHGYRQHPDRPEDPLAQPQGHPVQQPGGGGL